jgi:hypothetical protein
MSDEDIKKAILDSHMRGEKKVVHWVKKHIPDSKKENIIRVLESLNPKDRYKMSKGETSKHYYHPIFTPFRGGYQMDLLQQSERVDDVTRRYPAYFFIAINVNNRYGYAYPAANKNVATVLPIIQKWVEEVRSKGPLVNISADREGAWRSKQADEYFKNQNIALNLIDHERHSALGIVDRFIRTLRDMNVRTQDSKHETRERRFRDFTAKKMTKLIAIYNSSLHSAIGMTPEEMAGNEEAEKDYIIEKLYEVERRHKIADYDLPVGSWARYMVPRDQMQKRRWQLSEDFVWITNKQGNSYVCMAANETVKRISRWRLVPYDELPEGQSVLKSWHNKYGVIGAVKGGPKLSVQGNVIYKTNWLRPPGCGKEKDRWDLESVIVDQKGGAEMIQKWKNEKEGLRTVKFIKKKIGELYEVHWTDATDEYPTDETEDKIREYHNGIAALEAFKHKKRPKETHAAVEIPEPATPRRKFKGH